MSKIQKENVDRISTLPDELLSLILSRLPTTFAVRTSILSNRWKYLWTSITGLHFEAPKITDSDYTFYERNKCKKYINFANFVDHVFRSCRSSHIQKLSLLNVEKYMYRDVIAWTYEAIKHNVSEMDIVFFSCKYPSNVFSCTTLKVLSLVHYANPRFERKDPVSFNLPCVKVLHIKKWSNINNFIETLISSCPVLEDLFLEGNGRSHDKKYFMVTSTSLKTLQLQLCAHWYYFQGAKKLVVMAPNLEYLRLSNCFIDYKLEGDFSTVIKACVNIDNGSWRPIGMHHRFKFPELRNLRYLEVFYCHDLFWSMIPAFLQNSPRLEVLSIEQQHGNWEADKYTWDEPTSVPECLHGHLEIVNFKGFTGTEDELQLLEYVLRNGKVLQRLTISCSELKPVEKTKFCEQLLSYSDWGHCHIQFQGEIISNLSQFQGEIIDIL